MNITAALLIFALLPLSFFISGCSEDGTGQEKIQDSADKISGMINAADASVEESMEAIVNGAYDEARVSAIKAKEYVGEARKIYGDVKPYLSKENSKLFETLIEYEDRWATLTYKTANVRELGSTLSNQLLEENVELALPKVELLERAYRENADDWKELADFLNANINTLQNVGIDKGEVEAIYALSTSTYELADSLSEYKILLKAQVESYTPVAEREILGKENTGFELIPVGVASFFESFDSDKNGKLSIGEAQEFFYWVENNVAYRYDDEDAGNTVVGFEVGDGREGGDYRQTPAETLTEKAGDCEDMATLEVAFYRYFGIDAYVVGVDASTPGWVDHAAAIVRIGDNAESFEETLGNLLYYKLENVKDVYGNEVSPGVYMIVDNSYSGAFGYISGGVEEGTFTLYCVIPLDRGYGDEWNGIVEKCVSMD
ncbi:transglutaminase-like domain-containing protein [Geoglobus acetivorans]